MITYTYTRVEPMLDSKTSKVVKWVIGLTASKTVSGIEEPYTAYIDGTVSVASESQKVLGSYTTEEIQTLADNLKTAEDWETILSAKITAQENAPSSGGNIDLS